MKIKGREKSETLDKRTRTQYDRNGKPIAKTERKEEEIPRFRRIRVAKDVINISCVAIEKETKKVETDSRIEKLYKEKTEDEIRDKELERDSEEEKTKEDKEEKVKPSEEEIKKKSKDEKEYQKIRKLPNLKLKKKKRLQKEEER